MTTRPRPTLALLAALIPGARLVILPDVSHGGPLQDPDGFHRVVEEFLATARF